MSSISQKQKDLLKRLLGRDDVVIVMGPKARDTEGLERWAQMRAEEVAALSSKDVEYYVVSPKDILRENGMSQVLSGKFAYAKEDESGENPTVYFNRLQGPSLDYVAHELGTDGAVIYGKSEHPYADTLPLLSDNILKNAACASVQIYPNDNDKFGALLFQVSEDDAEDLERHLKKEFNLGRDFRLPRYTHENGVVSMVIKTVPRLLMDSFLRDYGDYVVAEDKNVYLSVLDVFTAYDGDRAIIEPPMQAEKPRRESPVKRRQKPNVTNEQQFQALDKQTLADKLKETKAVIRAKQDITGAISGHEIFFQNAHLKSEEMALIARSLMYYAFGSPFVSSTNQRDNGYITFTPNEWPQDEKKKQAVVSKMLEVCGQKSEVLKPYMYRVGYGRKLSYKDGIGTLKDIPVYFSEGRNIQREAKEIATLDIHLAPVMQGGVRKLAILVNAPIVEDKQMLPILDLLHLRRGDLKAERHYETSKPYTIITVPIADHGIFRTLCKTFGVSGDYIRLNQLKQNAIAEMPKWGRRRANVPEALSDENMLRHLVFVDPSGKPSIRAKVGAYSGQRSVAKERRDKPVERKAPKRQEKEANDELQDNLREFIEESLAAYQVRSVEHADGADAKSYALYFALTPDEYNRLRDMVEIADIRKENKSGLVFESLDVLGEKRLDKNYVRLVRIKTTESLHENVKELVSPLPLDAKEMASSEDVENTINNAFIAHAEAYKDTLKSETRRQTNINVNVVDALAEAMVYNRAAIGYVTYESPQHYEQLIQHMTLRRDRIAKAKDDIETLKAMDWSSQQEAIKGVGFTLTQSERAARDAIDALFDQPQEALYSINAYIRQLTTLHAMVSRYATSPTEKASLPVILACGDNITKDNTKRDSEGKRNNDQGSFHVISASVTDRMRMDECATNPDIAALWDKAEGLRVLEAHRYSRIKDKKFGKKGAPAAWFIVSPALAAVAEARANEMMAQGMAGVTRDHVHRIHQPLNLNALPFRETFLGDAELVERKEGRPPERILAGMTSRAVLVNERQDHKLSDQRISEEHKGSQPVLYLAVRSTHEVVDLLEALDSKQLLKGQKQYAAHRDETTLRAIATYNEELAPVQALLQSDSVRGFRIDQRASVFQNPESALHDKNPAVQAILNDISVLLRKVEPEQRNAEFQRIIEDCRTVLEVRMAALDNELRSAGAIKGTDSVQFLSEEDAKIEAQVHYLAEQVEVVKTGGNKKLKWEGDSKAFAAQIGAEKDHGLTMVKIYLDPKALEQQGMVQWRRGLAATFHNMHTDTEALGERAALQSTKKAWADGTHRNVGTHEERVKQGRQNHSTTIANATLYPDKAKRTIAEMTVDSRAHEASYIEANFAAIHGMGDIAQSRQAALRGVA